ncbi:MAG: alpha/beta fold hydrolase [Caldimonas sp.]
MNPSTDTIEPPSRLLQFLEVRAAGEFAGTLAVWPLLRMAPRGDGHAVLVLPGLSASDTSTRVLRRHLAGLGHDVHGWGLGRNLGPRAGVREAMLDRIDELHESSKRPVSLVGWSLGGAYARALALRRPHAVRNVVTLGSPIAGDASATSVRRLYDWVSGQRSTAKPGPRIYRPVPAEMPSTSIYSRSDGVVAWRASLQPEGPLAENLEVVGSHLGLGVHAPVLYAVADRLAQPVGGWKPFNPPWTLRAMYPDPQRTPRSENET